MQREPVTSTSVASIGYDPDSSTLEIEFTDGGVYQYFGVPAEIHAGLMAASSHGQYLDVNVKKAGYQYARVA